MLYQPSTRHLIDSIKRGDRCADVTSVEYIREDDLYVVYYEVRPSPYYIELMNQYAGYYNWTGCNRQCFFLIIPESSKYFNIDNCVIAHRSSDHTPYTLYLPIPINKIKVEFTFSPEVLAV